MLRCSVKANEPTGWYAELEEETEEGVDEEPTKSDNTT